MVQVVDVFAIKFRAVGPRDHTWSVLFIVFKRSGEDSSIRPHVPSVTIHFVFIESPSVVGAVRQCAVALTVLHAGNVVASVSRTIFPRLHTFAVLLIRNPVALVSGSSFETCDVTEGTLTMHLAKLPHSLERVTVWLLQVTQSVGFVVIPHSFVLGGIRPDLDAVAVSLVVTEGTLVA